MICDLVIENSDKSIIFISGIFNGRPPFYHSDIFDKESYIYEFITKYSNDIMINDFISANDKCRIIQSFNDLLGTNESYDKCYLFKPYQNPCEYGNYNLWDLYIYRKYEYTTEQIGFNLNLKNKHYIIFKDLLKIFSESIQTVSVIPYIKFNIK